MENYLIFVSIGGFVLLVLLFSALARRIDLAPHRTKEATDAHFYKKRDDGTIKKINVQKKKDTCLITVYECHGQVEKTVSRTDADLSLFERIVSAAEKYDLHTLKELPYSGTEGKRSFALSYGPRASDGISYSQGNSEDASALLDAVERILSQYVNEYK